MGHPLIGLWSVEVHEATRQVAPDGNAFQMEAVLARATPSGIATERPATLKATRFTVGS